MINQKKSRAFWFGASDTKFIMSNWNTSTFLEWWQTKIGVKSNNFKNIYTISGTYKEHSLANHYAETYNTKVVLDRQVKLRKYRLRVNLDCETKNKIVEIKTHKYNEKGWKMPKEYEWQVWVQMFATKKKSACIYAYAMKDEDYDNFWLPIEPERITEVEIEYNQEWVENQYLPRLVYLCKCLKKKKTPKIADYVLWLENYLKAKIK